MKVRCKVQGLLARRECLFISGPTCTRTCTAVHVHVHGCPCTTLSTEVLSKVREYYRGLSTSGSIHTRPEVPYGSRLNVVLCTT